MRELENLKNLLDDNKVKEVKDFLDQLLKLYKSNSEIVDHIYIEQAETNKYKKNISFDRDDKIIKIK